VKKTALSAPTHCGKGERRERLVERPAYRSLNETAADVSEWTAKCWSGQRDSNPRPPAPKERTRVSKPSKIRRSLALGAVLIPSERLFSWANFGRSESACPSLDLFLTANRLALMQEVQEGAPHEGATKTPQEQEALGQSRRFPVGAHSSSSRSIRSALTRQEAAQTGCRHKGS
jgi:hypothetical protein